MKYVNSYTSLYSPLRRRIMPCKGGKTLTSTILGFFNLPQSKRIQRGEKLIDLYVSYNTGAFIRKEIMKSTSFYIRLNKVEAIVENH